MSIYKRTAMIGMLLAAAVAASSVADAADPPRKPQTFVLAVSGNPGTAVYARRFGDWLSRFHAYICGPAKVAAENVVVLCGDKDLKRPFINEPASAESVKTAIAALAKRMKPEDQFVLFLVGHGELEDPAPMLLLPGVDLSAKDLAESLEAVPAGNQVVLDFAGAAGDFVRFLAHKGRVCIAAISPGEEAEPVLCEFFLEALEKKQDGAALNLLEAYNGAAHETAMWISRQKKEGDEWIVEGRHSVDLFKRLVTGDANDPAARKLSAQSDANAEDAVVPLKMPEGQDLDPWWLGRRIVMEHPVLEDCGQEVGVSCLRGQGFEPLDGVTEGQPGWLARRVILGRPALEEGK